MATRPPAALAAHHQRLLAAETGAVRREPGGRLNLAVLFPNTYLVGMANLGLAVLYRLVNARPDALLERAFLPGREEAPLYRKSGSPLVTLESSRPVKDFDLVLATLPFENDAPHLAAMLELAGLGDEARDREGPLVVAGGVAAMLNPEPYAGLLDGFLLGDAEVVLAPFLEAFAPRRDLPRERLLLELAREVKGFYAPRFYAPAYGPEGILAGFAPTREVPERIVVPRYRGPAAGLARGVFRADGPEFGRMALFEVGRGCGHGCRFCAAGHVLRPPRLGTADDFAAPILAAARRGETVGLVSAAVSDLPGVDGLAREVVAQGGRLSVSSLRADRLSPELAAALAQSGHQSVALAPEAGSQRLRDALNKRLGEEDIFRGVEVLARAGVPNLRLYFMLGLPGEEEEDVTALIALVRQVRQQVVSAARPRGHLGRVTASLSAFVPKPFTPFQWEAMAPLPVIAARLARVRRELAPLANLKVVSEVPKYALLQGVLSRGDRRLAPLVQALGQGISPERAYARAGVDPGFFANRPRGREELLPWAFLDHGLSPARLWEEAERSRAGLTSPPCAPGRCRRCGACPPPAGAGAAG